MHFFTLVVMPPGHPFNEVEDYVEQAMAPFDEQLEVTQVTEEGETYWTNPDSFWDWWQIGGRWTGHLSDYDPEKDPANLETCDLCHGTGTRDWSGVEPHVRDSWLADGKGCNSCHGEGKRMAWPTQWKRYPGDIARLGDVRSLIEAAPPHYIVHEGVSRAERENPEWDGKFGPESDNPYFVPTTEITDTLKSLSDDCWVVVVDCHS